MKKMYIILMVLSFVVLGFLIFWGCSESYPKPRPDQGISDVKIEYVPYSDSCSSGGFACTRKYKITFKDTYSSSFYWPAFILSNSDTIIGETKLLSGDNKNLEMYVNYFDVEDPDVSSYNLCVFRCNYESDGGKFNKYTSRGLCDSSIVFGSFGTMCSDQCCTDTLYTKSRWYAIAYKYNNGIIGIKGDFWMWGEPKMCSYLTSIVSDRSVVYVNVIDEYYGYWCQAGFVSGRAGGSTRTEQYTYFEVDCGNWQIEYFPIPLPYTYTNIGCLFDSFNGRWYLFIYDIQTFYFSAMGWLGRTGNRMDVTGEIIHHETDMYGVSGDPMIVKNLECDLGSGWVSLPASGMKCAGDDFSEWKTEISADEIHIYDLKPQF